MKILTWILTLFFVGFAGYMLWNTDEKSGSTKKEAGKIEQPMIMKEVVLRDYDQERIKWEIKAKQALLYEKQKVSYLSQIDAEVFQMGDTDQTPHLLVSDKAKVENTPNLITLTGNINFKLNTGESIRTEALIVNPNKDELFNDTLTLFLLGENRAHSESMHYNLKTERLILNKAKLKIHDF